MDENNQILDVTYGKFSCRLEGFEDSVETMKMVVSFFHDLAGHDQFMDTALLAPDMETLARLTEEQTGHSVDIEATEQKVSLRVRPETADEDVAVDDFASEENEPVELDTPVQADEYDEEEGNSDLSSVAEKLKMMRAAAERKRVAPSEESAEDQSEPAPAPVTNPLSQRLSELAKRTVEAQQDFAAEPENAAETAPTEDPAEELYSDEEAFEANDINVFSNLSDEVGEAVEEAPSEDDADVDQPTMEDDVEADADMPVEADAIADATADDAEVAHSDAFDDEAEAATAEVADAMAEDVMEDDDPAESAEDLMDAEDAVSADDELDAFLAAEDEELEAAAEDEETEAAAEDETAAVEEEPFTVSAFEDEDVAIENEEENVATGDDQIPDTAETDEDAAEEEAPLVLTSDDSADAGHDDYNDDDEFDLEKEVAKVEAEIAARKGNEFARRGLPRHVEDAMSRIMSQTDQHLNQPENRRHRDAFAQLKAAVAATEAARQLGDKGADKRDPDEVYKDDLGAHDANDKSGGKTAPPLKLVKSQEVTPEDEGTADATPASASAEPGSAPSERLRQIATQKESDAPESDGGFAAFAASHGVTDLADQLEAAGAYICLVEGENDFSRPQVMKVVQSASNTEISREDGLRSFGRLLRQARLVKLANGRFQVAENTQFRPNGNRAAQG